MGRSSWEPGMTLAQTASLSDFLLCGTDADPCHLQVSSSISAIELEPMSASEMQAMVTNGRAGRIVLKNSVCPTFEDVNLQYLGSYRATNTNYRGLRPRRGVFQHNRRISAVRTRTATAACCVRCPSRRWRQGIRSRKHQPESTAWSSLHPGHRSGRRASGSSRGAPQPRPGHLGRQDA